MINIFKKHLFNIKIELPIIKLINRPSLTHIAIVPVKVQSRLILVANYNNSLCLPQPPQETIDHGFGEEDSGQNEERPSSLRNAEDPRESRQDTARGLFALLSVSDRLQFNIQGSI